MSKLIITQMPYRGHWLMVSALLEQGRIMDLMPYDLEQRSILGNIYVGIVERVVPDLKAAFVRIARDQMSYLPLKDCVSPVYKSPHRSGIVKTGDELLVQISREALKEKLPSATTSLSISGKFLVLSIGNLRLGMSGKLTHVEKERLRPLLLQLKPDNMGIVARTGARSASEQQIREEFQYLSGELNTICQKGIGRTCFSCLKEAKLPWEELLLHIPPSELTEIITDIPNLYQEVEQILLADDRYAPGILKEYKEPLQPLYKKFSLEQVLEEGRNEKVSLKSGGYLVIQNTEAFTAVDVNTGSCTGSKDAEALYYGINLEAAEETARQLRLRQISGTILIDFINMKDETHREKLMGVLAACLRRDPSQAVAVDMTKLQIAEVTRKKSRKSLLEMLERGDFR